MEISIADRFERVAQTQPEREAVNADGQQASYGALASQAASIAHHLLEAGVSQGDRVALCLEQGPSAFAAWLGVMKAGAIAVPLVPVHPVARLRLAVEDASPRFVLSDSRSWQSASAVADGLAAIVDVNTLDSAPARTWPCVRPTDPATILYTSGTSGKPKGVIQTHGNILKKVDVCAEAFGTTGADRFAVLTWLAMAQGTVIAANALLTGATLCSFNVRREGLTAFADWLVEQHISIYVSVASLFRTFARTLDSSRQFPDVRLVRIGGERVMPDDVAAYRRHFSPRSRFLVSYAATETGPIALHEVGPAETFPDGVVPVGKPFDGVTVLVRNEHGQQVPDGLTGELIIRSAYISPGYWGQPQQTARAFLTSDDTAVTGEREYCTGDLGRIRNGLVEHLGRVSNRIQIRGFSVELEEVEAALHACPDVLRAAAIAKPQNDDEVQIVAYVQPMEGRSPTAEALRTSMGTLVPEQMIPAMFVILQALPVTDSGKVDRQHLPDPATDHPTRSSESGEPIPLVAAGTETETTLLAIWRELLGVERLSTRDNFFDCGGHSLMAMRLVARIRDEMRVELPIRAVFEHPTIAALADRVLAEGSREILGRRSSAPWKFAFELNPGTSGHPVFFIPGGEGGDYEFLVYARLLHFVGGPYRFFGMRARSADGHEPAQRSVEQMARDYLNEIQIIQPEGPYLLVGNCIGGALAFELARQMERREMAVETLVLMDTVYPTSVRYARGWLPRGSDRFEARRQHMVTRLNFDYYRDRLTHHRQMLRQLSWMKKMQYVAGRTTTLLGDTAAVVRDSVDPPDDSYSQEVVRKTYARALVRYRPQRYGGGIKLIVSEEGPRRTSAERWARIVGGPAEIHTVPGDHEAYIRDHVKIAAQQLRICLDGHAPNTRAENRRTSISTAAAL